MPLPTPSAFGRCLLLLALCIVSARAQEPVVVKMTALPGLKFDQTRFAVTPGAKVTIELQNPDQMIHNLVITAPGAREEIVAAALALGAEGPAKNFIPDSKKVLWHTPALNPGETTQLNFTAPALEGVYPYVCTSMGHGFIMYGAMYVTTKPLPPLEKDPNVPPAMAAVTDASDFSNATLDRIVVSRTFLPDCGPAAIAVGLPGGHSYVFDAGLCRLRYAWKGGFVDNKAHWSGKGEAFGKVLGRIYYRAPGAALIRIGNAEEEPAARWRGYDMAKDGPTFRYTLNGCEVRETPRRLEKGSGIVFSYAIASNGAPVYLVADPNGGAEFTSTAGTWNNGVLTLTSEQAAHFTLTMTERPGIEPLQYWSMNDLVFQNRKDPSPGVVGRAFTPGGTDGKKPALLATGINLNAIRAGGTLMAWVRLTNPTKPDASDTSLEPIFSVGDAPGGTLLGVNLNSDQWTHLAITIDAQEHVRASFWGEAPAGHEVRLPAGDGEIYVGSVGGKRFLRGLLDEVRIYDRVLSSEEIRRIQAREAAHLKSDAAASARLP
jgi:azurin